MNKMEEELLREFVTRREQSVELSEGRICGILERETEKGKG